MLSNAPAPAAENSARRSAQSRAGRLNIILAILNGWSKYACAACETEGDGPQIKTAAKPETAVEKGLAGPGLLAFIVTSKFADYLPLYRLEDIFARQGFEIARGTQSIWCGDVADLVEPLYHLMAERVRLSHVVATDDTIPCCGRARRPTQNVGLSGRRRPSLQCVRF